MGREGFGEGHLGADSASAPHSRHPSQPLGRRQGAEAGGNLLLIPHPFPFTASFRRLGRHTGTNVSGGTDSDNRSAAVMSTAGLPREMHCLDRLPAQGSEGWDEDEMDRDVRRR